MAAATFDITLQDGTIESIDGADAYAQEGQMTTFFATDRHRGVIDAWAVRVASIRTNEVRMVRRVVPMTSSGRAPWSGGSRSVTLGFGS